MFTARPETASYAHGARIAPLGASELQAYARTLRQQAVRDLAAEISRGIKNLFTKINAWRLEKKALAELMNLDDAMLRDIGLSRADIPAAVIGKVRRTGGPSNENTAGSALRLVPRHAA